MTVTQPVSQSSCETCLGTAVAPTSCSCCACGITCRFVFLITEATRITESTETRRARTHIKAHDGHPNPRKHPLCPRMIAKMFCCGPNASRTSVYTKYGGLFCTENVILSCVPSAVRICCLYRKLFCFYKYAHTNTAATTNNTALVNNKTEYLVQDVQNNSNINSNTCLHALISDTPSPLPAIYITVQYCI